MSLYEVERMVGRLEDYLGPDAQMATLSKDAQEFSERIKVTNQRLEQVMAMIDAGDMHQAMQLERMDPCLSDLVMHLDFPKSTDFRELCKKNGLETPAKIKRQLVARLNDLYAEDLDTLDELWREYNGARLRQDFVAALEVIRRIMKAKPDDKNAQQELFELEKVDFEARFQELEDGVNAMDYQGILPLIDKQEPMLQKFELNSQQQQTWTRAKELQLRVWISWLGSHRNNNDWQSSLIWAKRIQDSINSNGIILPPADSQSIEEIKRWADIQQAEFEEDAAFNQHYIQLQELLGQSDLPNRQPDMLDFTQAQLELNQLSHAWQNSQQYSQRCTQRITQEVYDKFHLRARGLEDRILQLRKKKNILIAVASVVVLIGLGVGIILYTASGNKKDWVNRVEMAMGINLCLTVSNHLAEAEMDYGTNSIPKAMAATYTKAKKWLAEKNTERELVASEIDGLIQMSQAGFQLETAELTSTNISTLSNKVVACCGDELIQKDLKLALLEVQKPWSKFRIETKRAGEKAINQLIAEMDRVSSVHQNSPDDLHKSMPGIRALMETAAPYSANRVISIRQQLRDDFKQVGVKLKQSEESLQLYRQTMKQLGLLIEGQTIEPTETWPGQSMEQYLLALKELDNSGFLTEDISTGLRTVLKVFQGKYLDNIMLSAIYGSNQEYMSVVTKQRGLLHPQGQLADTQFWKSIDQNSNYLNIMTNEVKEVAGVKFAGARWSNELKQLVIPPNGYHKILGVAQLPGGFVYLDIKEPFVPGFWLRQPLQIRQAGKKVVQIDITNKVFQNEYAYPPEVAQYRSFWVRGGLAITCMAAPNQPVWQFKASPWKYIASLNIAVKAKQIDPMIAAYQQLLILNHILTMPMKSQYEYGIPSEPVSKHLKGKMNAVGISNSLGGSITPVTWMEAGIESKNEQAIARLQQLASDCVDLEKLRGHIVALHDGGVEFVGFFRDGPKFFTGKAGLVEGRAIFHIDGAGLFVNVKTVGELGDAAPGDTKNPVEFSPLLVLKTTNHDGGLAGKLEPSSSLYRFLPDVAK